MVSRLEYEPAEKVLSAPIPAQTHDPACMTRHIRHLLSRCRVVDSNDLRISRGCQVLVRRAESNGTNGLYEAAERMGHFACAVVEDVYAAVLVT